MKSNLEILGIYTKPSYREEFIQHIHEMHNIKLVGEVTLGALDKALQEHFPEKLDMVKDFIDFQKENGAEDSSELCDMEEGEVVYVSFNVYPSKEQ